MEHTLHTLAYYTYLYTYVNIQNHVEYSEVGTTHREIHTVSVHIRTHMHTPHTGYTEHIAVMMSLRVRSQAQGT